MSRDTAFHADVVGSMLRPPELVEARAALRAGSLANPEYRAIEDAAVDEALRIQEDAGVDVVTDGEMRRDVFFDFLVKGFASDAFVLGSPYTVRFHGHGDTEMNVDVPFTVVAPLEVQDCPAIDELAYAKQRTSRPLKVTLPGPGMMLGFWGDASREAYPDPLTLVAQAGEAVKRWIGELGDAGCEYIQLDAPELIDIYCDPKVAAEYEERGIPAADLRELLTDLVVAFGQVPRGDAKLGMHLCRGNGTQAWIAEGGYESFSEHVFTRAAGFDVFHLEYDDERSGGFEPLEALPDDKVAVLGLVSTKWTRLEAPDGLRARVNEAAQFHPMENLGLATQCGFASANETAEQRKITPQTQSDKLRLVADVAHSIWSQ